MAEGRRGFPARAPAATRADAGSSVCIGRKGVMPYVLAVVTQFRGGAKEVCVKARGNVISEAVEVAEIVRSRFMPEVKPKGVRIGSEELRRADGRVSRVPFIEITLARD